MGKNVAVFVDVANIFYAAKAAGVDIDYVTLLKSATAGRDFVRAYAYTGLDPDNENQRNFHQFLARNSYKVVSKDIRKYGDGKVKANLDIELVVDLMKTARNLDIAVIVSGDGDFASAIRAVQEMGVRVRGHQLPRQHVVGPDRGRGPVHRHHPDRPRRQGLHAFRPPRRGRRRGPVDDRGPREAVRGHRPRPWPRARTGPLGARRGAGRRRAQRPLVQLPVGGDPSVAAAALTNGAPMGLVALPGEKLSRASAAGPRRRPSISTRARSSSCSSVEPVEGDARAPRARAAGWSRATARRRRRRRGGRGRGRGRREDEVGVEGGERRRGRRGGRRGSRGRGGEPSRSRPRRRAHRAAAPASCRPRSTTSTRSTTAPRAPRSTPFGSVWDTQLGTGDGPSRGERPRAACPTKRTSTSRRSPST